ncbi:monovalent cation:proton antiporter-2 (CPA2) family protein [Thiomicrorhabdus sp. ZW0627]|uniref:monovalent cation:proton antiporter-2 (CPA2) family protein n=1 Tax=Thiomicrorhabdus sp. ZW0627 TaxID=3039774 RepID=UPI0024373077|nr:monovalent cation:proton antiporter-2 (CPA2) family protein [Thiomicrorhabdus sp. ZW0627]MDG6772833.1 monovalent cation:proton antiporter-2 (CPA2) family protein [Thiomicrorhabdus sp. ZW0627]
MNDHLLLHIVLLLGIAVITVSISRRLHFPPILSYIIVGIIVGPYGFGWIQEEKNIKLLAELGIVFLLFSIGLEFSLSQMLTMRKQVFGLGSMQVFSTGIIIYIIGWFAGLDNNTNIVVASAFALSSTAIVIKQLTEQAEIQSRHGRSAIGILIFQDIMAIPLLILIPALAMSEGENALTMSLVSAFVKGILIVVVMHAIGRYLLRPLFHEVASAKSSELFTLTVLLVALSSAALTEEMGLSMTLGAFLAGMMLGETEYRHQIESDIRPFQDILLGLFFVTVGMLISIERLLEHFWIIIAVAVSIILVKGVVIYAVARLFNKEPGVAMRTSISLAQVGEFGLVLMTLAFTYRLLPEEEGNILLTAAVISMAIAPLLVKFNGNITRFINRGSYAKSQSEMEKVIAQENIYLSNHIILCGFGRVGQTVSRFLHKAPENFVALDMDIRRVTEANNAGERVYYGDASKERILHAAGIDKAKAVIITFSDYHASMKILHTIRHISPDIPVLVRTIDDSHLNELLEAGATEVVPDTFESSIMLSSHLLLMVGQPPSKVLRETREIRKNRYKLLENFYPGQYDNPLDEHQIMNRVIHTVLMLDKDYAVGKKIKQLPFDQLNVKVDAIARGHVRGENPDVETRIRVDDRIVISGLAEDVERADYFLKTGNGL